MGKRKEPATVRRPESQAAAPLVEPEDGLSGVNTLLAVCAFASFAECVNTMVTPDFTVRGTGLTGTFCNVLGATLCGLAAAVAALSPSWNVLADVFKGGFVAAFTSFCHMVENTSALRCSGSRRDLLYFSSAIVGGPGFFVIGKQVGLAIIYALRISKKSTKNVRSADLNKVLVRARNVGALAVLAMVALQYVRLGRDAACELAVGVAFTSAACWAGGVVGSIATAMTPKNSSVNWATIFANGLAVSLLLVCQLVSGRHAAAVATLSSPGHRWFAVVVADKFRGSFCGALSGYGGFAEDSSGLASANPDAAAANLGMNTVLAVLCISILQHLECGEPVFGPDAEL